MLTFKSRLMTIIDGDAGMLSNCLSRDRIGSALFSGSPAPTSPYTIYPSINAFLESFIRHSSLPYTRKHH